ncbi:MULTISPECIES: protein kinase [unclassified Streptomyces]|uniref:protein kinase domain-containing protein n=1 Tax=unclassified Streptomyces TaxID=2593676 RepID=UPI0021CD0C2B|nr:protein kinase [Streptomyces sp. sk2.1]
MGDDTRQQVIAGRYLLLEHLGSGGMGTVWRATDQLLKRSVAIKEVHLRAGAEEFAKRARRAHREARAIAGISHPNVVNVYDLVDHEDRLWVVMELVKGRSLAEHVAELGPMPPSRVAGVGLQLLAALDAVHAIGALHRDVKPANVLMRDGGGVVLCDFGIVALADTASLTTPGGVIGTLDFIAPERLSDRPAGPPSDLFSLGATLCALLTGRSPFARSEPAAVLHAVMREEPEIPAGAGPLAPVLEALLSKNPADRPTAARAADLLRPLATAPGSGPTPGAPPHDTTVRSEGARRRPSRRAVLSAGLALAGGAGAGFAVSRLWRGDGTEADAGPTGRPTPTASDPTASHPAAAPGAPSSATLKKLPVGAAMSAPDGSRVLWLFYGDQYVRVDASDANKRFRRDIGPKPISNWSGAFNGLKGFTEKIDAVLPVPGYAGEYWVFSGARYIRIGVENETYNDSRLADPEPLGDWENGFGLGSGSSAVIDALMPVPDEGVRDFWVFSGSRYARYGPDGTGPGGRLVKDWQPLDDWRGSFAMHAAFRKRIDAAVQVPGERNNYWVFSGGSYVEIRVADGVHDYADELVHGPRPVSVQG